MAKTYNRLVIDVNQHINTIGIRPVQGDTKSRYLDVSLYENGAAINLTGEQVRINFEKADGTTFFNQGEITDAEAGRCQFALTNEILSEAKVVKAQISIWNTENEILSTEVFTILVTESIRNDAAVESENEFGVLVVLFQEIQNALDLMQAVLDSFGEPGEKAAEYGVDTFWGILETLAARTDMETVLKKYIVEALNSTLGTDAFLPLDENINERIKELLYKETKTALASSSYIPTTATVVLNSTVTLSQKGVEQTMCTFSAPARGVYFLEITGSQNKYTDYSVYVGTQKTTYAYNSSYGYPYAIPLYLRKDDQVKITCLCSTSYSGTVSVTNVKYWYIVNGNVAKIKTNLDDDVYTVAETFTPEATGKMLIMSYRYQNIMVNGSTNINRVTFTNWDNDLYYCLLDVYEGVEVTVKVKASHIMYARAYVLETNTSSKMIDSVQRGTVCLDANGSGTVTIAPVNPSRCVLLYSYEDGYFTASAKIKYEISKNTIVFSSGIANANVCWQLINFL